MPAQAGHRTARPQRSDRRSASYFGSPVSKDGKPNGAHWARQDLAVRAVTLGRGTTDIQLNIIAELMLESPAIPNRLPGDIGKEVVPLVGTQPRRMTLTSLVLRFLGG
jgi:hypothetical protein